jgi:hypothetical protein
VEKMDIKPFNDIIILAVLSHAKNDGQNRYPVLRFSESDKRSFLDVADLFLAKQPAYFLSLVNACNDSVTSKPLTTPYQFAIQPLKTGNASLEKYQQLFKKTNHTVAVTYLSAQAGSATFVDELGGESFSALIASLKSWMAKEQTGTPTWEKVLFTAQTLTIQRTQNGALECPYLEIVHVRLHEGKIQREGQGLELCK